MRRCARDSAPPPERERVRDYSWRAHCEALDRAISGIQTTETQRHRDIYWKGKEDK